MARKKETSRVATFYSMSQDRLDEARKIYDSAVTTLASARTFGTPAHAEAAAKVLTEAAENYADALRTHASLAIDYAKDRTRG
jgi:hypothetical protein